MSRTMLVTGASKGIGRETVRRFFYSESDVTDFVLVARPSQEFTELVESLEADGKGDKKLHAHQVDLADRQRVLSLTAEVAKRHGNIDILVNNAGYTAPASIQQVDFSDFERTMAVNVYAPFTLVQGLLHLGNHFELVVNVASTAGMRGRPGWLTYSTSKSAAITMSEVMKEELAILGTRVVCISPGRCATGLRRTLAPNEDPATIMQPEDVANVIEMLTSDVGRYIDSENLVVRS